MMKSLIFSLILFFASSHIYSQNNFLVVYDKKVNPDFDYKTLDNKASNYFMQLSKNISKFKYNLEIDFNSQISKFSSNYEMSTDGQTKIDRQILNILNSRYPIYTDIKKDSIYELSNHPLLGSEILTRFKLNSYNWVLKDSTKIINGYKCKLATGTFSQKNSLTDNTSEIEYFAWYTSELPSQYGPSFFTGLPGLVLLAGYNMFIFEVDIIKPKDIKFDFPKNKSITEEELILKMKSVFKSRN